MIFKLYALLLLVTSCQSVPVGSVVETSKFLRPSWIKKIGLSVKGGTLTCTALHSSRENLPNSIKKAQINAKIHCDSLVASYYLKVDQSLARRYLERDIVIKINKCGKTCSEINDIYYEKIAEENDLFSYRVYVNMKYPARLK